MSITTKNLQFSGWPECRVVIALDRIVSVEKTNYLMIIPNAILIKTSQEEYFFGSFLERELCYTLLNSMVEVSKGLKEINGPTEFHGADDDINPGEINEMVSVEKKKKLTDAALTSTITDIDNLSIELSNHGTNSITEGRYDGELLEENSSSDEDIDCGVDFEDILTANGVVYMHHEELAVKSKHLWKFFWQKGTGYRYIYCDYQQYAY